MSIFEVFMIMFAFGTFLTGLLTLVEKMVNKK